MVMLAGTNARIVSDDYEVGRGVVIEEGVEIRAERVRIGDYAYIGHGTRIYTGSLSIGDYTRINADTFAGGALALEIGHNCYIGGKVRLDSHGGLTIGNNVGIGDHSQIWTHVRFGDPILGCRYNRAWELTIEDDVWLVGRVTVGGARVIGSRAIVFNESNVTKDIPADTTWAGNPAKDITEKHGSQFRENTLAERKRLLEIEIAEYELMHPEHAGILNACIGEFDWLDGCVNLDVSRRCYEKTHHPAEVGFLKWTLAKFIPRDE